MYVSDTEKPKSFPSPSSFLLRCLISSCLSFTIAEYGSTKTAFSFCPVFRKYFSNRVVIFTHRDRWKPFSISSSHSQSLWLLMSCFQWMSWVFTLDNNIRISRASKFFRWSVMLIARPLLDGQHLSPPRFSSGEMESSPTFVFSFYRILIMNDSSESTTPSTRDATSNSDTWWADSLISDSCRLR